jgi:hypothetical protein
MILEASSSDSKNRGNQFQTNQDSFRGDLRSLKKYLADGDTSQNELGSSNDRNVLFGGKEPIELNDDDVALIWQNRNQADK